jgi:hypothetical protein
MQQSNTEHIETKTRAKIGYALMLAQEMEKVLESIYKDACKRLEKIGYDDIEYRRSDEHIDEELEAHDYEFDEDGEFIR